MSPRLGATLLLLFLASCGKSDLTGPSRSDDPPVPVPTSLSVFPTGVELSALGETLQMTATVLDQGGAIMRNASVVWSSTDPEVATVSEDGVLTAVANGGATVVAASGALTGSVSVTVEQVPAALERSWDGALTAPVGDTVEPTFTVRDAGGHPVPDARVLVAPTTDASSIAPDSTRADRDGRVSFQWVLGSTAGVYHAVARLASLSDTIAALALAGPPAAVQLVSGDAQTGVVAGELADPVVVRVVDALGNGVIGETLSIHLPQGGSVGATTPTTDAEGLLRLRWTLGTIAGTQTLALQHDVGRLEVSALAGPAAPATLLKVQGDGQEAPVGAAVPVSPSVRVTDAYGNPVSGVTVEFVVTAGEGGVENGFPVTDATGTATVGSWVLGAAAGANELEARAQGVGAVAFTATGTIEEDEGDSLAGSWQSRGNVRWKSTDGVYVGRLTFTFSDTSDPANLKGTWAWGRDYAGTFGSGTLSGGAVDLTLVDVTAGRTFRFTGSLQEDGTIRGQLEGIDVLMRKSG